MATTPDLTEAQIFAQLRANVRQNSMVYGAAMAFEPGTFKPDDSLYSPYVYRGRDDLVLRGPAQAVYLVPAHSGDELLDLGRNAARLLLEHRLQKARQHRRHRCRRHRCRRPRRDREDGGEDHAPAPESPR